MCPSSKYGVKCAERCRCKNGELNSCMHCSIFGFFELNVSYIRYHKYQCYGICLPFKCDAFSLIRVILIMYCPFPWTWQMFTINDYSLHGTISYFWCLASGQYTDQSVMTRILSNIMAFHVETLTQFGTALPRVGQAIKVGQAMRTHFQISPKGKQCHKVTFTII